MVTRIMVIKGISQYDALRIFADELIKGFIRLGIDVEVVDLKYKGVNTLAAYAGKQFDAILSFNGMGMYEDKHGKVIFNEVNAPFFAFLVDHPYMHHNRLKIEMKNYNVFCVDNNHVNYIKNCYSHIKTCTMIPHGGIVGENILPYKERSHELVFFGSYTPSEIIWAEMMQALAGRTDIIEFVEIVAELMKTQYCTMESAVTAVFDELGIPVDSKTVLLLCTTMSYVDSYVRSYFRENIIQNILEAGYTIDLYGNGWEQMRLAEQKNACIHQAVDFRQTLDIMGDSKVVLNVMPWFKDGSHERIFCTMLNGAVSLTDYSQYIAQRFTQYKDIVIYSLNNKEELISCIDMVQQDQDLAEYIAMNGQAKASRFDTWEERAKLIISIVEKVKESQEL